MNPKVLIVGGGPAGSACGITTARAGLETIVFEKDGPDRNKVCGDGILPKAQKYLDALNLYGEVKEKGLEVQKIVTYMGNSKPVVAEVPVINLQRSVFDKLMRDKVESFGGKLLYNSNISSIEISSEGVIVEDSNQNSYKGDVLVLSTGARIHLARKLGFSFSKENVGVAIRGYMSNNLKLDHSLIYFSKNMDSFGWVLPCPGNVLNVGLGSHGSKNSLKNLFDIFVRNTVKEISGNSEFISKPKGCPLRIGLRKGDYVSDRVLITGENIDCDWDLLGAGIGNAIETGIVAGDVIIKSKPPYNKEQLSIYENVIKERTEKTHKDFSSARNFLKSSLGKYLFIKLSTSSIGARKNLAKIMGGDLQPGDLFSLRGLLKNL
ncbi:MAG: NAD(P)/FAD-dependent oxidoreductase [candidate division Zixibacteria bacterium]|nr:NAD(P)/FAD-dependent oxidoreductase [candidate division Zixibacteria bacterium]